MARPPKPSALKKLQGNPGRRPLNEREPDAPVGMPEYPEDLGEAAREMWDELGPRLVAMGVLTLADGEAFAGLCTLSERARHLRRAITATPEPVQIKTSVDGAGNEHVEAKPNPLYVMERETLKALSAYLTHFGLTPSSRSKIIAAPKDDKKTRGSWAA